MKLDPDLRGLCSFFFFSFVSVHVTFWPTFSVISRMGSCTRMHLTLSLSTETGVPGFLWERKMWIQEPPPMRAGPRHLISRAGRPLSTSSCPWRRALTQGEAVQHKQVKFIFHNRFIKKGKKTMLWIQHIFETCVFKTSLKLVPGPDWFAVCVSDEQYVTFLLLSFLTGPSWQI